MTAFAAFDWAGALLAVALLAYLFAVLLIPEDFS